MNSLRKFLYQKPIISTLIIILIEFLIIHVKIGSNSNDLIYMIIKEAVLAAIAIYFVYLVNGRAEVVYSSKGVGYAFKKGWFILVIAILTGLVSLSGLMAHNHLADNLIIIFLGCILLGIFIGLFEEGLFRGLFLNALLARYGSDFKGVLKAVIISSLLFGFLHVAPSFISEFNQPGAFSFSFIGQIIGKTIQTGMIGFILAAIYLKNHNLWSVAILHGINDFLMFLPGYFYNSAQLGNYVQSNNGFIFVISYGILCLLYLPLIIVGYRILKNLTFPQPGFFRVCWFPVKVKK